MLKLDSRVKLSPFLPALHWHLTIHLGEAPFLRYTVPLYSAGRAVVCCQCVPAQRALPGHRREKGVGGGSRWRLWSSVKSVPFSSPMLYCSVELEPVNIHNANLIGLHSNLFLNLLWCKHSTVASCYATKPKHQANHNFFIGFHSVIVFYSCPFLSVLPPKSPRNGSE